MPIYEYRCERGHTFEVLQRMADDPVSVCTDCDATVERVLHPVAVHFKGSGFYTTDYGKKKGRGSDGGDPAESKNGADGGEKASKKDSGSKAGNTSKSPEPSKTGSSASSSE
jgi:putative FmdB family regulatory protein